MNQLIQNLKAWIQLEGYLRMIEHIFVLIILIKSLISFLKIQSRGKLGLLNYLKKFIIRLSFNISYIRNKKYNYLETESIKNVESILAQKNIKIKYRQIPQKGLREQDIYAQLVERKKADIDPGVGDTFAYVYNHSQKHSRVIENCFHKYLHYNALNPILFNSLRVIENQVVRMSSSLFHGDQNCVGNITSCGTESLLLAMKTYRDYRGVGDVIMCITGHPGINKGCHYVGLNPIQIPYDQNKRMSLTHLKKSISSSTIVVVCSAPQYPHGVVDDVPQIAKICQSYGVPLHVDAAIGGFVLPFIQKLGRNKFKPFDFRVPGVMSINADVHKFGYAPKGSSVLIYRNSTIRMNQYYAMSTWPGGIYISPTAMGTRNGGCLSSAWGSLLDLGIEGFKETTKNILAEVDKFVEYISSHQELKLMAIPDSTIVSFECKNFSCYKLADALQKRGLHVQKQSNPDSIHLTFMPSHIGKTSSIINKINESLKEIELNPNLYENGSKAVYGMMADIPDESITEEFVVHYLDKIYKL